MKYIIYWYHLTGVHTDPYTEGYIGVTNNEQRRHKEHILNSKDASNKLHLYNAIRKHTWSNISKVILHELDNYAEASEIEYLYRTEPNIGWNTAIGGYLNIAEHQKTPITLYHKNDPTNKLYYNSIKEASENLGISEGRITAAKQRERSVYGFDGYAILFDPSFEVSLTKTISEVLSEAVTGIKRTKPSHFKGITNRWSEEDKLRISSQHKGKTISEEAKNSSRIKNRENNPSCKQIVLQHMNNQEKQYVFHSISEASRQLQIPYSRLKSKVRATLGTYGRDGWAVISLGSG